MGPLPSPNNPYQPDKLLPVQPETFFIPNNDQQQYNDQQQRMSQLPRRRHSSGDGVYRPMPSTTGNSAYGNPPSSIARYNPAVASLLQNDVPQPITPNNNLMLLSQAASSVGTQQQQQSTLVVAHKQWPSDQPLTPSSVELPPKKRPRTDEGMSPVVHQSQGKSVTFVDSMSRSLSNEGPSVASAPSRRRMVHVECESRRRSNITSAMERLSELLPDSGFSKQNGGVSQRGRRAGLSQASLLCHVAQYLQQLELETEQMSSGVNQIRENISEVSQDVARLQSSLPPSGIKSQSISSDRQGSPTKNRYRIMARFDAYVSTRNSESWRFVLLSSLFKPLYPSFFDMVNVQLVKTNGQLVQVVIDSNSLQQWIAKFCSLPILRQGNFPFNDFFLSVQWWGWPGSA